MKENACRTAEPAPQAIESATAVLTAAMPMDESWAHSLPRMDLALAGKHIVLTRALSPLGRAQAAKLTAAGARVTMLDLPTLEAEGQELSETMRGARFHAVDLNVAADVQRAAVSISTAFAVDALVNNAAENLKLPFGQLSANDFNGQLETGCKTAFLITRAIGEGMKARSAGSIVNVCASTYNGEWNGYVSYATSNAATVGLTRSLARELGAFGIRVNAVSPGAIAAKSDSRIFGDRLSDYDAWVMKNQCLKRRIKVEDVANLVAFLASDMSAMITSQNLVIDGGW
jgi:NAD(P)-dependent dehydrogenase (short-subunit alcohol dehydrogenase family)